MQIIAFVQEPAQDEHGKEGEDRNGNHQRQQQQNEKERYCMAEDVEEEEEDEGLIPQKCSLEMDFQLGDITCEMPFRIPS